MDVWDIPMYDTALAARLTGLTKGRVRRWLRGYEYSYATSKDRKLHTSHKDPVIIRSKPVHTSYASFLDLIDLLFINKFLKHGISLQRIRKALYEAEILIGGHHFAQSVFFTDGKNIYLQVKDKADALMELLSGGQWVISSVIKELAHQIEFDSPTGFAKRWYPLGPDGLIVLDPNISFGNPTLVKRGVTTANVYDFFLAEGEKIESVCSWMNLRHEEVEAAVNYEIKLAA